MNGGFCSSFTKTCSDKGTEAGALRNETCSFRNLEFTIVDTSSNSQFNHLFQHVDGTGLNVHIFPAVPIYIQHKCRP